MGCVHGYDLDVYCDFAGCGNMKKFGGGSRKEAFRDARRAGWKINLHADAPEHGCGGGIALCLKHSGVKFKKPIPPAYLKGLDVQVVPLNDIRRGLELVEQEKKGKK